MPKAAASLAILFLFAGVSTAAESAVHGVSEMRQDAFATPPADGIVQPFFANSNAASVRKTLAEQSSSSLVGMWASVSPVQSLLAIFKENGYVSIGYNLKIDMYAYVVRGSEILMTDIDGNQMIVPFSINANQLTLTINSEKFILAKHMEQKPSQSGFIPGVGTIPQSMPLLLEGTYICNIPQHDSSIVFSFSGGAYQAMVFENGKLILSSAADYDLKDGSLRYRITASTNQQANGTEGAISLVSRNYGFDMLDGNVGSVKCLKR